MRINSVCLLNIFLRFQKVYAGIQLSLIHIYFKKQKDNYLLAEDVYAVTSDRYREGIASMTEVLQDEMQMSEDVYKRQSQSYVHRPEYSLHATHSPPGQYPPADRQSLPAIPDNIFPVSYTHLSDRYVECQQTLFV